MPPPRRQAASGSQQAPLPQRRAPSSSESGSRDELAVVVSFNIGAKDANMFSGPAQDEFHHELTHAFREFCRAPMPLVILLQECSATHLALVLAIAPQYARVGEEVDDATQTLILRSKVEVLDCKRWPMFPNSDSVYKRWRAFTQVTLKVQMPLAFATTQGHIAILVNNVHIIDGKMHRRIPGDARGEPNSLETTIARHPTCVRFAI